MAEHCYHCGDAVIGRPIVAGGHAFCCNGCKTVYKLLSEHALTDFYKLEEKAGNRPSGSAAHKYTFLDVDHLRARYIAYEDEQVARVTLFLPQIHCSSCIYLLENISRIEPAIRSCQVNFVRREAHLVFDPKKLKLSALATLLDNIGYAPNFGKRTNDRLKTEKRFLYRIGVAGFAFGSVMLWSFPEYLGIGRDNPEFRNFTSWLSLLVSVPVIFFSASAYFISAWKALRFKSLNLDVPIAIGILALYLRSVTSILQGDGPGYMDSFTGFVFFLLIGKWFQDKTYRSLSFERDYTAYFPVAVTRLSAGVEEIIEIEKLEVNDHILIRNEEVIPCDSQLFSDSATIDYSFVTGESNPVTRKKGDFIYAGGKLIGSPVVLSVQKESSRSHLTSLWNEAGTKKMIKKKGATDRLSVYFLAGLLLVAALTGIYWYLVNPQNMVPAVVSVLIVACPCALALSGPFVYGNTMRLLGRKGLYLKNTEVIASMHEISDIVFDKTGTLTESEQLHPVYEGPELSMEEKQAVYSLASASTHPLSRAIARYFSENGFSAAPVSEYREIPSMGISGIVGGKSLKIGNADFTGTSGRQDSGTTVFFDVDGRKGSFRFQSELRPGIGELLSKLGAAYRLHLLSGDHQRDQRLTGTFPPGSALYFGQTPLEKRAYVRSLQQEGRVVLMIGDGLNDSGALTSADVGIALSEDMFRFTPSSDAILEASQLTRLSEFLDITRFARVALITCYTFSILYNLLGLAFAVSAQLTPLFAAILMPLSSMTIVMLSTVLVLWHGRGFSKISKS